MLHIEEILVHTITIGFRLKHAPPKFVVDLLVLGSIRFNGNYNPTLEANFVNLKT